MDIDELKKLENTDFFIIVASYLGAFKKVDRDNFENILKENNADVIIKLNSPEEVAFHFKQDNIAYCNASMDFSDKKLINFRAQIVPVSFFKKKIASQYKEKLLRLLEGISNYGSSEIVELKKNEIYQLAFNDQLISLNQGQNIQTRSPFVSIWCEYKNQA